MAKAAIPHVSWLEPAAAASAQHIIDAYAESQSEASTASVTEDLTSADSLTGAPAVGTSDGQSGSAGSTVAPAQPSDPVTGITQAAPSEKQLYIVFLDGTPAGNVDALGLRVRAELGIQSPVALFEQLNGFTAMLSADQAQRLQKSRGVLSIEADTPVSLVQPIFNSAVQATRDGSASISAAIGPQRIPTNVSDVWNGNSFTNTTGKWALILDTGVSTSTGDLIVNSEHSRNFASGSSWTDGHGHGTHVAGTVAAINNGVGVVGVAPGATVVSIRVLGNSGSGFISYIVNGINYAAGLVKTGGLSTISVNNIVANMSLGGGISSSLDSAISAAATADPNGRYLRFAVAAGNDKADADNYSPARTGDHPNIYTVSAVKNYAERNLADFSNWDNVGDVVDDVDYATPGVGVVSLGRDGSLVTMSGTSMASPAMAGILLMGGPSTLGYSIPYGSAAPDPLAGLA